MKKKLGTILLCSIFILGMTGCGTKEEKKEESLDLTKVYEQYIKEKKYEEKYDQTTPIEYTILDINNDGIDELILNGKIEKEGYYKGMYQTLIVSYKKEEKKTYHAYSFKSSSGLMYNKKENQILYIVKGLTFPINYYYGNITDSENAFMPFKTVQIKADDQYHVQYNDGKDEITTAKEAMEESKKYKKITYDKNLDGTENKEKEVVDVFENHEDEYFKVGNYKLKYGTYKLENTMDVSLEITLREDGTCLYNGVSDSKSNTNYNNIGCTYYAIKQEYYGKQTDFIVLNLLSVGKESFEVVSDNEFNSQWLMLKYQG